MGAIKEVVHRDRVYCIILWFDPVETALKRLPFEPIEPIAYGFAQLSQPVIRMRMRLEQQADPIVILGHVTDVLQHRGQSERIVTGTCGQDHCNTICFELGVLVEGTGKDLCSAADQAS